MLSLAGTPSQQRNPAAPESHPDGLGFTWEFPGQQDSFGSTLALLVKPEQASLNVVGSLLQSLELSLRVKAFGRTAAPKVLGVIKL